MSIMAGTKRHFKDYQLIAQQLQSQVRPITLKGHL